MIKDILKTEENKMIKTIEHLKEELKSVRSGKASISLLDNIKVDYYGNMVPLSQVAALHTPDPKTITVKPWDKNLIPVIEKEIMKSSLGLNPNNDGTIIRIPIPAPSEEQRREYVKIAKKMGEEAKIAIRNIRRDGISKIKEDEKNKLISEDDSKRAQNEIQKLTDKYVKMVDDIIDKKEKEIMEV